MNNISRNFLCFGLSLHSQLPGGTCEMDEDVRARMLLSKEYGSDARYRLQISSISCKIPAALAGRGGNCKLKGASGI
jgi:hypothetical protein